MSESVNDHASHQETHENSFEQSALTSTVGGASMPPPPFGLEASGDGEAPLQRVEDVETVTGGDGGGAETPESRAGQVNNLMRGVVDEASAVSAAAAIETLFLSLSQEEFLAMKTAYDNTYPLYWSARGDNVFSTSTLVVNLYATFEEDEVLLHQVTSAVGLQVPSPSATDGNATDVTTGEDGSDVSDYDGPRYTVRVAGYEEGQVVIGNNPIHFEISTDYVEAVSPAYSSTVMPHELTILRPDGEVDTGPYPYVPNQTGTYEATIGIGRDGSDVLMGVETLIFRVETPDYRADQAMVTDEAESYDDYIQDSSAELTTLTQEVSLPAADENFTVSSNLAASHTMDTQQTFIVTWNRGNIPPVEATYTSSLTDEGSFEWFIARVSGEGDGMELPDELVCLMQVDSEEAVSLGLSDAYPLYRMPSSGTSASITYTAPGRYAIVVRYTPLAGDNEEEVTSRTATFWQSLITEPQAAEADRFENELNSVDDLIASIDPATLVNVSAQLVIQESGVVQDLDMFYGTVQETGQELLVDASSMVTKRAYYGDSFAAIFGTPNGAREVDGRFNGRFNQDNEYPNGVVHISVPGTDAASPPYRYNTDGQSNLSEAGSWLGTAGTILTVASIACPILAVPGVVMRGIALGAAAAQVAGSTANIMDELQNANPNGRALTMETLNLASAVLGGAGEMLSGVRSISLVRGGRTMIATASIAVDSASTFMVAQDGINALIALQQQDPPLPLAELRRRQGEIIASLALTGGLFIISTASNIDTVRSNTQLNYRAQQAGFAIPEGHALWENLDFVHIDALERIPVTRQSDMLEFLLAANPQATPANRLSGLMKASDWASFSNVLATAGDDFTGVMTALSNPVIASPDALNNLLNNFTLDEILTNWSVVPSNPGGSTAAPVDPTVVGTTSADPATAGTTTTAPANDFRGTTQIDDLDLASLSANEQDAYLFLTSVGLTPEISGDSIIFTNSSGDTVAQINDNITYTYSGFNGDIEAVPGQTVTVLGRFNDQIDGAGTQEILPNGAFQTGENPNGINVLNIVDWTPERNFAWLLQAIDRGDAFQLISNPAHIPNYFGTNGELSVFAYEIGILIDQGELNASVLPAGLPFGPAELIHPTYQAMKDSGLVDRILDGQFTDAEVASITLDD